MFRDATAATEKLSDIGRSAKSELGAVNGAMLRHFEAAIAEYDAEHKSAHWDLFPKDFRAIIRAEDAWPEFRLNGISTGYDLSVIDAAGKVEREIARPKLVERTVNFYVRLVDLAGPAFVHPLLECEVGAPPYVQHQELKLNVTDLRHIYTAWRIKQHVEREPDTIVEIGGGYGGLLSKLKKIYPDAKLISFDLPEVCAAQFYYLNALFGDIAGAADDERGDITVLPGWRYAQSDRSDLVINSQSMMEMNRSVIARYFAVIQESLSPGGLFYCANRYLKGTVGEPIRIRDYPFDARWHFVYSAPMMMQPHVHELIGVRTKQPRVEAPRIPSAWSDVWRHLRIAGRHVATILIGDGPTTNPGIRYGLRNVAKRIMRWAYLKLRSAKRRAGQQD